MNQEEIAELTKLVQGMTPRERAGRKWREKNKERHRASTKAWRERNVTRMKEYHLVQEFGLTWVQYIELLTTQEGVCAICKQPPQENKLLSVDHDHTTQEVRGLLCSRCNLLLAGVEDTAYHEKAVLYLESRLRRKP